GLPFMRVGPRRSRMSRSSGKSPSAHASSLSSGGNWQSCTRTLLLVGDPDTPRPQFDAMCVDAERGRFDVLWRLRGMGCGGSISCRATDWCGPGGRPEVFEFFEVSQSGDRLIVEPRLRP